jgi:hypothetical protein
MTDSRDRLPPSLVLRTGQSSCHDAQGARIDCLNSGQDGELRRGRPWPEPRFEVRGDLVTDRLTGLVWPRDCGLGEVPLTWAEALEMVAEMNAEGRFGHEDWRLPNRRELRSLIDHQTRHPALPHGHPFVNLFPSWHWSSTTAADSPAHAWYVDMDGGRLFYGGKDQSYMVWPVRGRPSLACTGQSTCFDTDGRRIDCASSTQDGALRLGIAWPAPRFRHEGSDVLDRLTGLVWRRDAGLEGGPLSWPEALERIVILNRRQAVATPWRLPNINELESLVDASQYAPALPPGRPFPSPADTYWSSTTSVYEPDWAWALYLDKGAIGVGQKGFARFHAWAVRELS